MHNLELQKIIDRRDAAGEVILPCHIKSDALDENGGGGFAIDVYDLEGIDCQTALYTSAHEYSEDYTELLKFAVEQAQSSRKLRNMLDCTTGLLSGSDKETLELMAMRHREHCNLYAKDMSAEIEPFRVYDTEYGYVVYVHSDVKEVVAECEKKKYELSKAFWETYTMAAGLECMLINFDADAP